LKLSSCGSNTSARARVQASMGSTIAATTNVAGVCNNRQIAQCESSSVPASEWKWAACTSANPASSKTPSNASSLRNLSRPNWVCMLIPILDDIRCKFISTGLILLHGPKSQSAIGDWPSAQPGTGLQFTVRSLQPTQAAIPALRVQAFCWLQTVNCKPSWPIANCQLRLLLTPLLHAPCPGFTPPRAALCSYR